MTEPTPDKSSIQQARLLTPEETAEFLRENPRPQHHSRTFFEFSQGYFEWIGNGIQSGFTTIQNTALSVAGQDPKQYNKDALLTGLAVSAAGYGAKEIIQNANILSQREIMARQLLGRGHASVDEILHASYGEWPPKGLDIIGSNDQRVKFMSAIEMAGRNEPNPVKKLLSQVSDAMQVAGRATVGDERVIGINKGLTQFMPGLLGQSSLVTTMGHEVTHSLQGDHYWRAQEVFGQYAAQNVWRAQNDAKSNMVVKEVFDSHTSPFRLYRGSYLREGLEIQARMHEILSDGYQRWGTMPQNREQLFVAMENVGLKLPDAIKHDLEQSPTIQETREIFGHKPSSSGPARNINTAVNTLTKEGKVKFWSESMPELYSDLIEMYGDKEGRARFGLGKNPWANVKISAEAQKTARFDIPGVVPGYENKPIPTERASFGQMGSAPADPTKMPPIPLEEPSTVLSSKTPVSTSNLPDTKAVAAIPPIKVQDVAETSAALKAATIVEEAGGKVKPRGGLLVNAAIGAGAGIIAFGMGKDLKESGKISLQMAIPYGETAIKIAEGDKKGAVHSAMTETAGLAGAIAGASGGAMAGAALGSVVPIIGTAIGGVAGGIIGGIIGGVGGGMGADALLNHAPKITDTVTAGVDAVMTKISGPGSTTKSTGIEAKKINWAFAQVSDSAAGTEAIKQQQKNLLHSSGLDHLERNGKIVDTEAILRDPAQRKTFIDGLEKSAKSSNNPDTRGDIEKMIKASRDYAALEDKKGKTVSNQPAQPSAAAVAPAQKSSAETPQEKIHTIQWQH